MTTRHHGQAYFRNEWGANISQVTLRHRRGNDPSTEVRRSWSNVPTYTEAFDENGHEAPLMFEYETGLGSPRDYWWIEFTLMAGGSYSHDDSFDCSLTSDDDGRVDVRVGGDVQYLYINFSSSSGCFKPLQKR